MARWLQTFLSAQSLQSNVRWAMGNGVRWACCGLLLLAAACVHSDSARVRDFRIATAPVLTDLFPPHEAAFADGALARGDVVYAVLPGYRPLTLDLYTPSRFTRAPARGFPLIVFVHGGGWMGGHTRHAGAIDGFPRYLAGLAARGYVVASVNYRLSGEAQFPAALLDIKLAVRWLRGQGSELRLDDDNIVLWGTSAGGQLAALAGLACGAEQFILAASPSEARTPALANEDDCVQGIALWYAPSDFMISRARAEGSTPDSPEARYLGCAPAACEVARLEAASPAYFVDASDPPVLIVHGTTDVVVPFAHAAELSSRLRAAGVRTELVTIEGVGHSFIGATPEQTRESTLLALARTEAFLAEVTCRDCKREGHAD